MSFSFSTEGIDITSHELLPPGKYPVVIIDVEHRSNKSSAGKHVWIQMEVVEGEHAGRYIWNRYNVENANADAESIGKRELTKLCHAVGLPSGFKHVDELLNRSFMVVLKTKKDRDGNPETACVAYEPVTTKNTVPTRPVLGTQAPASTLPPVARRRMQAVEEGPAPAPAPDGSQAPF